MMVLFRNIPADTYHNDIIAFTQPVIKGGLFRAQGDIRQVEILALKEIGFGALEFQALARIEPDAAADRVIKKLNGLPIRGSRVAVRQYHVRNWKNDKRSELKEEDWQLLEKRTTPNRRRQLKVYKIALPEYK
jgi:hypothetical protein